MKPAFSVIGFTTLSGLGYGMLFVLGLTTLLGLVPTERWLGVVALALALGSITLGLLSSTLHLGHPERAWRAISQWRSSWLSREGLAALVTYVPRLAVRHRLGLLRKRRRALWLDGVRGRSRRPGHGPLHRHDLCVAAADQSLAPAADHTSPISPSR